MPPKIISHPDEVYVRVDHDWACGVKVFQRLGKPPRIQLASIGLRGAGGWTKFRDIEATDWPEMPEFAPLVPLLREVVMASQELCAREKVRVLGELRARGLVA